MPPLTPEQALEKANNKIERLELASELNGLSSVLNNLFADAPIGVAETTSKEEISELINAIKQGTATNNKIARFLEIANSLGI